MLSGFLLNTDPGPPAKVVVVGRRRSSNIYVAWEAPDKPNGPLEGYKVTVTWTGQGVQPPVTSVNYETHSTVNKQLEILGLQPGSQYLITVRARNTQNEEGVTSNPEAVWIRSDGKRLHQTSLAFLLSCNNG